MRTLSSRIGDWQLPRLHMWKERQLELRAEPRPLVGPSTSVATIGSCFASELAKAMDRLGLRGAMHPAGLFYTSRSIRQELAHVFGESSAQRDEALWTTEAGLVHPFKDYSKAFASEAELRAWSDALDEQARALFGEPEVIVVTLGLIEAWLHPERGVAYRQIPHPGVYEQLGAELHRLSVADIRADLEDIWAMIQRHTRAKLILTVSPIPLYATFTGLDVRVANSESKTRIRAAVSEFIDAHPEVAYFHSYEIVTSAEKMSDFMLADGRHVSRHGVDYILKHFVETFGDGLPVPELDDSWLTRPQKTAATSQRTLAQRMRDAMREFRA